MSYTPVPSEANQQTVDPTAPSSSDPPPSYPSTQQTEEKQTIQQQQQQQQQQQPVIQYVMQPQITQQPYIVSL